MASAVVVAFWLVLVLLLTRKIKGRIFYGLVKKHIPVIVLYLHIFNAQAYILFKILASGFSTKHS